VANDVLFSRFGAFNSTLTTRKNLQQILSLRPFHGDIDPVCLHNDASSDTSQAYSIDLVFLYDLFKDGYSSVGKKTS
jgi:hypothetical protein